VRACSSTIAERRFTPVHRVSQILMQPKRIRRSDIGTLETVKTKLNLHSKPSQTWIRSRCAPLSAVQLMMLFLIFVVNPLGARAQEFLPESQVKAAYLFNFLKFVEWPGNPVVDGQGKWVIGIVGDSPVGGELARLAERKSALNRDLQVKKLRATDDLRACNILFISESERKRLPLIFAALRGSSVMTVADMHHFIESGGMVQLVVEDARVRLTIDVGATDRARLKVSSKLMALTLAVTADVRNRK
jgi:hypothetical protein